MDYYGIRIFEEKPILTVNRSWKERLFSFPWKPFQKTKVITNVACPPEGSAWRIGNNLHVRPEQYSEIMRITKA